MLYRHLINFSLFIGCIVFLSGCVSHKVNSQNSEQMKIADNNIRYNRNVDLKVQYNWGKEWSIDWEEDFDKPNVDLSNWNILEQGLNWNNEKQAYTKENIYTKDGCLVLEGKKENWTGKSNRIDDPNSIVTQEYTSGEIHTKGKKSWTYGKFEMRAKLPKTKGILSAFWMTPEDDSWPPEIDIVEMLGHNPKEAHFTNHYGTAKEHLTDRGVYKSKQDLSKDFHIYAVEWEPESIRWYVDNKKCFETTKVIPDVPFYLRLSLPIGPDWEGNPDKTSVFPQKFIVDWVKVYQRK